jgi:hypothetical protein
MIHAFIAEKRNVMRLGKLVPLTFIALPLLLAQAPPGGDEYWPKEIGTDNIHLLLYQPQVDSWKGNRIEARSAVIVTLKGDPTEIFGTVLIRARTEVDKEARLVSLEDIEIKEANFPSATALQGKLRKAVRESVPSWPRTVSLDRLLADLAINQTETKAEMIRFKNDPPRIIFSKAPAVLILIDGDPVHRGVEGTTYTRVVNTPALLLFNSTAGALYLDGGSWWMTASLLTGPWTAAANPPQDLDGIKQQLTKDEEKEPAGSAATPPGKPPAVYVSTVPAELLVTQGDPAYAPITRTSLLYATNSDNDIFMDTESQQYYTLLAGRWFRAKSLDGPWEWVPGEQLPGDFARIPVDSPKGHVLASIPGTEQAREAIIANQIPQTATVQRSEARLDVQYDGPPQFHPIEGTDMEYAINTSAEVLHAAGRYYAVQHGVWFVANSAQGPWAVAEMIPAEIYTIPPSCPLYHLRYVYVYGATPEFVYVGYTPGYTGAFISDGVVVFGTGWWYPGWCGVLPPFYCFGWPWTWGFGFRFSYWGGGWFWRPAGNFWWYHTTPVTHRIFSEHWNMHWNTPNRTWIRGNVNAYSHWEGNGVVTHSFRQPARVSPQGSASHPDLYVGRGGQIYQHRSEGWYQQDKSGQWQRTPSNPGLELQRRSRALGQSRQGEFENGGQSPGVPRTSVPWGGRGGR